MELELRRIARREKYTIGRLMIDGSYFCDTIEDKDRGLRQSMSAAEIGRLKVKHQTAIPTGRYRILMNVVSAKFAQKPLYRDFCGGRIPRFEDVKGFDGICMHSGVDADSSSGCPVVGENKVVGKVVNSWATFKRLYMVLKRAANNGEEIWITVS